MKFSKFSVGNKGQGQQHQIHAPQGEDVDVEVLSIDGDNDDDDDDMFSGVETQTTEQNSKFNLFYFLSISN